ncbi:MAG: putative protein conserved in bacteria (DUF2059) [Rhodobacteraceae bacterium HLUCCA08]|nr:MAG: putative protein conserved in bacteria (DUF2059) [Rhodobacteraceae bacterium HLUCCA08]
MLRLAHAAAFSLTLAGPVAAQQADPAEVFDAMRMDDLLRIMQQEGLAYGDEIGRDLFGAAPPARWDEQIAVIYDQDRMGATIRAELAAELEGADVQAILDFFASDLGRNVIALELAAREALLDDAVEDASREAAIVAMADEAPRVLQVERYIAANDLIETNVVGALNSNYAFYMGMMDGGALPGQMGEDQILSDVWGQEPEIRQNTTEWLYSFLLMAYGPLSDEEMEAYIAFSESPAGQEINAALFEAFDGMFIDISRALGVASAEVMTVQEL